MTKELRDYIAMKLVESSMCWSEVAGILDDIMAKIEMEHQKDLEQRIERLEKAVGIEHFYSTNQ